MTRMGERIRYQVLRNLLRAGDVIFSQGMINRLSFLEQAQWWNPSQVREVRDQSLRALVRTAYQEVPFYRALFDNYGLKWQQMQSAEALTQMPVVTKAMLRPQYPHATTRPTGQKTYKASSSGSTGTNFFVHEDAETAGRYRASFLLALEWAGWRIGQRHLQTGINLARNLDRRLKDTLLGCRYFSAYALDDGHLDHALDVLEQDRIEHLWGYPGSLYLLARRAMEKGWSRSLKSVVTWGDNVYSHYRSTIERAFGVSLFDTYGCGEGMQIAAQCGAGPHYHIHALDVIVEFLDDAGQPVPKGETGNIVVTRLHPGPMPLLRYRLGDVGVSGTGQTCSCGRGFELLQSVQGRDTDIVVTESGKRLIVHFFTGVLEHFPEIGQFQVVQEEIGSIALSIVPAFPNSIDQAVESRIVGSLRRHGATDLKIDLQLVDQIPVAASGKRRFVISKVGLNLPAKTGTVHV